MGMRENSLFRTEIEGRCWKGKRRNDDTEHVLWASRCARHIHLFIVIYSTFIECLSGAPSVEDTVVN